MTFISPYLSSNTKRFGGFHNVSKRCLKTDIANIYFKKIADTLNYFNYDVAKGLISIHNKKRVNNTFIV